MLVRSVVMAVLLGLLIAPGVSAQEVVLSVAVSLKDAVEEIGRGFTATRPGVTLRYNFGASGDLQKQIEAGAPVDAFLGHPARLRSQCAGRGEAGRLQDRYLATGRPSRRVRDSHRDRQSADGGAKAT